MSGSLRTSSLATFYYRVMQRYVVSRLQDRGLTPDKLTWLGLLVSVTVPAGFWVHPALGFLLILVSGMADSLDGLMARNQNRASPWGAFLDSTLDRISDFFYLLGFWVLLWQHAKPVWASLALFICLLVTLLISYAKARAEGLGCQCPVGLMERGVRLFFLLGWTAIIIVLPGQIAICLWSGLVLYVILCLDTVIRRISYVRQRIDLRSDNI